MANVTIVSETSNDAVPTPVAVVQPGGATDTGAVRVAGKGVQVYDLAGLSGDAIDTGVLDVSGFSHLWVFVVNTGGSVSGSVSARFVRDDGSAVTINTPFTVAAGSGSVAASWGPGVATSAIVLPLPRRVQFTVAGSAGATIRLTIHGR